MKIPRKPMKADVPSTAMGDIAFNLLIFFVILARAQDDSHLKWKPASAANVQGAGATKVSVLIDADSKMHLNGQEIGQSQLATRLEELLGNAPAGERTVLLKVDRDAQSMYFEPAIEAISEAGGELVHVLEEKK
ncbi:Biopolymer transport protein ExbD/TolR [Pirellula staleyi DSM 6068]|uniref:Biopolymer transport protein ExbD/TolR n=1 Tax=Pirellula staleyi (strain ATCC 27377 / DSM 6068 / ICPB 4128) TaxID=530564 RepID=D2R7N0_PIRSD|nr:biopolymer transporter ExbD [Pirellula staleyi]ADB17456.1 Biopolymer transport protein ExbD/TolR [Pirellula staleyi DSM 6068]